MKQTKPLHLFAYMKAYMKKEGIRRLRPFTPSAFWKFEGDVMDVLWEDVSFYTEWINPQITLMRANYRDGKKPKNRVIGCEVWGMSSMRLPPPVKKRKRRQKEIIYNGNGK